VRETFYAYGHWENRYDEEKQCDRWHFVDETPPGGYRYFDSTPALVRERKTDGYGWWKRPSIHMPRKASRITLKNADIRVDQVQSISEDDAIAEGIQRFDDGLDSYALAQEREVHEYFYGTQRLARSCMEKTAKEAFRRLWDSINKARGYGWDLNPWVRVVNFERV
jgi:hypothetical protein